MAQTEGIVKKIEEILQPLGFEIYPFKVGWYNDAVEEKYKLPYPDDTLSILVISIPDMWEKAFIPFVKHEDLDKETDILNQCMIHYFGQVKQSFPQHDVEVMHQFEMPNGQAKILVQTAAHVAGGAFYYQRFDVTDRPWPADKKIYGVCYHPKYGGWIGIEGAFIFKDVLCPDLPQPKPQDVIPSQEKRVELLEKFNIQQCSYRDLFPVPRKYSEEHIEFLSLSPQKRRNMVQKIKSMPEEHQETHVRYKQNGATFGSSDIRDLEKKGAVAKRKEILKKFPSVLNYIVGKKNDEPAVKVFLKREDINAEKHFREFFIKHTIQFVNVTREMEETSKKEQQDKFQPQMDKEISKRLGEIIKKQSRALMASHSQIIRISAGNIPEGTSIGKPCIEIYCLDKLLIPTGEQELPKQLEGFPVHIQEGFIMFGFCEGCETLKHGCSIGRPSDMFSGSIGFFAKVRKPHQLSEERGFLTAAHVALPNTECIYEAQKLLTELNLGNSLYEIVHPSKEDSKSPEIIGKVSEAFFGNYGQSKIGIDAAFVNCYEELGAHFELQIAKESELTFDGNTIVIKTGRTTSTTKGKLTSEVSSISIDDHGETRVFENVYCIQNLPHPEPRFFNSGDSGSGVYIFEENGECNKALGIAFAFMSDGRKVDTFVCKMNEIVKAFNINVNTEQEPMDLD